MSFPTVTRLVWMTASCPRRGRSRNHCPLLLPPSRVSGTAQQIIFRRVAAFPVCSPTSLPREPYCVMETEQIVNQLVAVRSESEQYIVAFGTSESHG